MNLLPNKFFVTSGSAVSGVSDLNAFDRALIAAGIGEQNLVPVSSVIPIGAEQIAPKALPMGAVTHCVLAHMRGSGGETISAGIAYAFRKDGMGGYVAEGRMHGPAGQLRAALKCKMEEMGRIRNIELKEIRYAIEEISAPADGHGACVAALVFSDYRE